MRLIFTPRAALAVIALVIGAGTSPASAASCHFLAESAWGGPNIGIYGSASVGTKKATCRRAKRRCLRKLMRAWKEGKAQGYACVEMRQAK
jgi:hypothetical protein